MQPAIDLDPNRSDSYLNMALLQAQGQQWDAAEASYRKAVALDPKSTNALGALGNFYQWRGRFPEAERQFRQAIESAPKDPERRGSLARLQLADNKSKQREAVPTQPRKDFPTSLESSRTR